MRTFIGTVNAYCAAHARNDPVPLPPGAESIAPSQFRRTLAWHIYRRPRGIIAGAIQHGHLRAQMFLGYAGNYVSGFRDLAAMEDLMARLEATAANADLLGEGEHVSGPAAGEYVTRVAGGQSQFQGRVIRTNEQAQRLLANPNLQVFVGRGITCVFSLQTAKCQTERGDSADARRPNLGGCVATCCQRRLNPDHLPSTPDQSSGDVDTCHNIARTDRDVEAIRGDIVKLREVVADPLSPPIRTRRDRGRLQKLEEIVQEHDAGR